MLTEVAQVDSSSTRQLWAPSVNISVEYPELPDHDSMNNPLVSSNIIQLSSTQCTTGLPYEYIVTSSIHTCIASMLIQLIWRKDPIDMVLQLSMEPESSIQAAMYQFIQS